MGVPRIIRRRYPRDADGRELVAGDRVVFWNEAFAAADAYGQGLGLPPDCRGTVRRRGLNCHLVGVEFDHAGPIATIDCFLLVHSGASR